MVPSTGATSAVRRAADASTGNAASCDSCQEPVKARDVDRVELTSLQFDVAQEAAAPAPGSPQRLRERLVAGVVNQPIDFAGPGGHNQVLNRAYFLSDRSVAEFNASAVGRAIDVRG